MAKNIIWLVTVVTTALLQTTWPEGLKLQEVLPDLSLILVVYFAMDDGEERAMFTGLIAGVYQDVASNNVLGHHVLCLVLVGYFVGRLSTRLITDHPAVKVGLVFIAAVANSLLYHMILFVQNPGHTFFYALATSSMPAAFYSALISPVLFMLLHRLFHREDAPQGGLT